MKILLFAFASLLLSGFSMSTQADVEFCLAKPAEWDSQRHKVYARELGLKCVTLYYNLTSQQNRQNPLVMIDRQYLSAGYKVILTTLFNPLPNTKSSILQDIIDGKYDQDIRVLVSGIKHFGHPIIIRPLHELDGDWYPWGMYTEGNTLNLAVAAMKHIIPLFREAGELVKIELNFNRSDGHAKILGEAEKYIPQFDSLVDSYSISSYNRCGTSPNKTTERSFSDDLAPAYERLASLTRKDINVAETSTAGLCSQGEKIPWFTKMFDDLNDKFPRVKMVTLYFGAKEPNTASNAVRIDWGLQPEDRNSFRQLLQKHWPELYQKAEEMWIQKKLFEMQLPWNFFSRVSYPMVESGNPVLNPVTDNPVGRESFLFMSQFTQRVLYPVSDSVQAGLVLRLNVFQSNNENMWWNNRLGTGLSFGIYGMLPRNSIIGWGYWFIEPIGFENRWYTAPTPSRYGGGQEFRIMSNAGVNFGGNWSE